MNKAERDAYLKGRASMLKHVRELVSECSPQGQYERFDDQRLYVGLRNLAKNGEKNAE